MRIHAREVCGYSFLREWWWPWKGPTHAQTKGIHECTLWMEICLNWSPGVCLESLRLIQGGPERMQQLWLLISWTSSMKHNCFLFYLVEHSFSNKMTPWSFCQFWVRCLDCSAILVRQCNFQNLVLFRPYRPLEHRKTLESLRPVLLTKPSHWKQRQCEQTGQFITQHLTLWSEKFLLFQRSRGSKK